MKFKTLLFSTLGVGMMLASCGGPGEGRGLEEMKNATTLDSLSNLFGQLYAIDYWSNAGSDSTALSEKARQGYLKGIQEGISKYGKDKSYLEGYQLGLQLAMFADEYEQQMGVKLDLDKIVEGLAYGLRSDSTVNPATANQEFQRINMRFQMQQDELNKKKAQEKLASFVKGKSYIDMGNGLYGKILRQGKGEAVKIGDMVQCNITITDSKGKKIGIPMPKDLSLNNHIAQLPIGQALMKMKPGAAGEFITTAYDMFNTRATEYGLEISEPLVLTIEVLDASTPAVENGSGKVQGKVTEVQAAGKTAEQAAAQPSARARAK